MRIVYYKNGKKRIARRSNGDLVVNTQIINNRTTVILTARADIALDQCDTFLESNVNFSDLYFLNGYQSWTDTKEFKLAKRLRNIKKSPHIITKVFALAKYGDAPFYKYSIKKSHGYDIFYSKGKCESFIFNLNFKNAYLIIELIKDRKSLHLITDTKGIKLAAGDTFTLFDYCAYDDYEEGYKSFQEYFPKKGVEKLFGYTSWYNYYQNIDEKIILRDLEALDSRFNLCQIDDGYETFVGDWMDVDPKKFPNGLEPIVKRIKEKGFKAGLWLAPFVAEAKSKVYKEHPDWIRKDEKGNMIKAGANWSGFYVLDIEKQEVVDYITKCLTHYMDMGFDFFKLDFLYAIGLPNYDGRTRCQAQNKAYKLLRDILKDKLILGCGANIINSYINFDYLRIGPDVSLNFDDNVIMRLLHRERISTKITIQNSIFRSIFNDHLFGNDPDVFLLRDDNIHLSSEQRRALTTINALFGSVLMTSDDIGEYDETKKKILANALDIFRNGKVISYITRDHLIDIKYNLNNKEHSFTYDINKGVMLNER